MTIRWARRALRDLRQLHAFIARDDPDAASGVADRIRATAGNLADFPSSGRSGRRFGTRELVIPRTPYLLIYRVRGQTVEILRVLHGAQRWPPE